MIYKGKVPAEEKVRLKELYPDTVLKVYPSKDGKHEVVIRAIDPELDSRILRFRMESDLTGPLLERKVDEMVFEECVVWPQLTLEDKAALTVGTIPNLSMVIGEISGYIEIDIHDNIIGPSIQVWPLSESNAWGEYTDEDVAKVKSLTDMPVYRMRADEYVFIIRPLTRVDTDVAQSMSDSALAIAKAITLWPEIVKWDKIPAGYVDHVANAGARVSGWESNPADVELVEL
jgi:hypothetical protein